MAVFRRLWKSMQTTSSAYQQAHFWIIPVSDGPSAQTSSFSHCNAPYSTNARLPILCGIFLMESLSVIIQRRYFKYTKKKYGEGRRVFLMAPLHHHYQKKGIPEPRIVTRFWIIGIILAVSTLALLKIR